MFLLFQFCDTHPNKIITIASSQTFTVFNSMTILFSFALPERIVKNLIYTTSRSNDNGLTDNYKTRDTFAMDINYNRHNNAN